MVKPEVPPGEEHPAVKYCQDVFPVLADILSHFWNCTPVLERVCRCWRYMVLSYRTAIRPLLPELANKLALGFQQSRQGCFLWATASIVREFSQSDETDQSIVNAVFQFYEQQATTFLKILNDLPPEELPDRKSLLLPNKVRMFLSFCSHRRLLPARLRHGSLLPHRIHHIPLDVQHSFCRMQFSHSAQGGTHPCDSSLSA